MVITLRNAPKGNEVSARDRKKECCFTNGNDRYSLKWKNYTGKTELASNPPLITALSHILFYPIFPPFK